MPTPRTGRLILFFCLAAAAVVGLDLWSKSAAFKFLRVESDGNPPHVLSQETHTVIPGFFQLEANYNYGAFSGWFSNHPEWLTALSAVALVVILLVLAHHVRRNPRPSAPFVLALALLWGGTTGNLHDRLLLGAVRDFIKWFVVIGGKERVWPNFNIADSAICTGVGLILLLEVLAAGRDRKRARERTAGVAAAP
jgi:signal peptidase II